MRTPFALIIQITPERLPLPDSFQMVVGMAVSGPAQDPACEVAISSSERHMLVSRPTHGNATPDSPSRKCDSTKPEFPFRTTNRGRLIGWRFSKVYSAKNRGKWKPGEGDHL